MKKALFTAMLAAVACCGTAVAEIPANPTTTKDYYAIQDEVVSCLNQLKSILDSVKDKAGADAAAPGIMDLAGTVDEAIKVIIAKQDEVQKALEERKDFTPAQFDDAVFGIIQVNTELKKSNYFGSKEMEKAMDAFTAALTGRNAR